MTRTWSAGQGWWFEAVGRIERLAELHGDEATSRADGFATMYAGRRGPMIIDVVFSGWRNYDTTLGKVGAYEIWAANDSIAHLAEHGPGAIGGRQNEAAAAQSVAAGLIRFADEFGIGDDEVLVDAWQQSTAGYEFGHRQDTFVGGVKGIGPALFAYLRMRSGADTIKPDTQVASALRDFGFKVNTSDPHAVLAVALRVAADLKMRPLVLDQLLWDKDWRIDLN